MCDYRVSPSFPGDELTKISCLVIGLFGKVLWVIFILYQDYCVSLPHSVPSHKLLADLFTGTAFKRWKCMELPIPSTV